MSSKDKTTTAAAKKDGQKQSRSLLITIGSIIILILAAVSFIFLPAMVQGDNGQISKPFGYYKKQPIEYKQGSTFASMMNYYVQQAEQSGEVINNFSYLTILNQAFGATVIRMAFADQVKASGFVVPDTAVNRILRQYFTDETGKYSPKLYNETSDSTKVALRKQVEEDLTYQQYFDDFFAVGYDQNVLFGLKNAKNEVPFITEMSNRLRGFDIVSFALSDYPEAELASYGASHADLFQKANMNVITVDSKAEAEKIRRRIVNNEITFADAVNEYSNKNYSDDSGALQSSYVYQLKKLLSSDEALQALLIMGTAEVSDVTQTGTFFSIFQPTAAVTKADFTDSTVLDLVYAYVSENDAGIIEDYVTAHAREFAQTAALTGFDEACESFDVTKSTTEPFPLNYRDSPMLLDGVPPNNPILSGASSNDTFLKTAFSLKQNEVSSPILLGNNVVVLRMTEEAPQDPELGNLLNMYYPIYSSQFDQGSAEAFFTTSSDVKNDVISVYLSEVLAAN